MSAISAFIDRLAKTPPPPDACNMYFEPGEPSDIRKNNLRLYLEEMQRRKPDSLIVGEAPGYQGHRWSGVSFCSEYIILNGVPKAGMFGREKGYRKTAEWEKVWKEPSATIVWGALAEVKNLPLIWAAYPFHPFKGDNQFTNRTPRNEELKLGESFLRELIQIFKIKRIIAVGNKAELTLTNLGYTVPKIRHPANGGATKFREGIRKYFNA